MSRLRGDDGAYAILYGLLVVLMLGMASIVVDLGLLRADKRDGRSSADAAALAGAASLGSGPYTPLAACGAAWEYALDNLRLPETPSPCAAATPLPGFPASLPTCPLAASTATGTVPGQGVTVSITWPVPKDSELLSNPDGLGSQPARLFNADFDGTDPGCDRLGVTVRRTRGLGFANALGVSEGASYARSVARATPGFKDPGDPYPLVILDPTSCNALAVSGGTSVIVKNKGDVPGRIGIDSDGTSDGSETNSDACNGQAVIVDAAGTGSRIEAMPGGTGVPAAIEIYGPSGLPARAHDGVDIGCSSSCLRPVPTSRVERITRTPFDREYNCGASCTNGSPERALDRFRDIALSLSGTPAGWTTINGAACGTAPPATGTQFFVDCGTYQVSGNWAFPKGATVVINGDLLVSGCLTVNTDVALADATCAAATEIPLLGASTNGLLSVLGDVYRQGSAARLVLPQTLLHQPLTSSRFIGSGFDIISWSAPYVLPAEMTARCSNIDLGLGFVPPAGCFRNLAFWTDAPSPDNSPAIITGGGALRLEGTYFLGEAKLRLSGGSLIDVTNAQFVAKRIEASGGSLLTFIPNPDRTLPIASLGLSLVR